MATTTTRTINYFEIIIQPANGYDMRLAVEMLLNEIRDRNTNRTESRYRTQGVKMVNVTGLESYMGNNDLLRGKLLSVRKDIFPELVDMDEDTFRDIVAEDQEGIVEFTHFLLNWYHDRLILALEYNHYGARHKDLERYLYGVASEFTNPIIRSIGVIPLSSDLIDNYQERLDNFAYLIARVHKNNIQRVNGIDSEFGDGLAALQEIGDAEYVEVKIKYDTTDGREAPRRGVIIDLLNKIFRNNENVNVFDRLVLKASDRDSISNTLEDFDILNVWLRSMVSPRKRDKSRSIESASIYSLMYEKLMEYFG